MFFSNYGGKKSKFRIDTNVVTQLNHYHTVWFVNRWKRCLEAKKKNARGYFGLGVDESALLTKKAPFPQRNTSGVTSIVFSSTCFSHFTIFSSISLTSFLHSLNLETSLSPFSFFLHSQARQSTYAHFKGDGNG